ncbi:hypothetical protein BDY19DRAFT_353159 [Irpex rosettiformis]|uniref:Uncharacterized protein n=1 Tax=Irpex rosettiformis TaxID=378272 RepID=A0ACB8TW46_9APHY|nr:hypothetical protein BDY19DRAFT_353159 [Irpex rosettiformis]
MSTTTTLVDFTDTQMLDYAMDGDFSMQNSPADWLAVEATMLDDNPTSAATDYSETIEVDMEPHDEHDGEITEYEMADDALGEVDYDGDAQLFDAETEAEQPDLLGMPQVPAMQLNSGGVGPVEHHPPTPPSHFALPTTPLADVSVVMAEPPRSQNIPAFSPSHEVDSFSVAPQQVNDEATPVSTTEVVVAALATNHSPALPEEPTSATVLPESFIGTADHSTDGQGYHITEHTENSVTHGHVEYQATPKTHPTSPEEHKEEDSEAQREEHVDATNAAPGPDAEIDPSENAVHQNVPVHNTSETGEEADPHEISEGVYIDPPPAVLLSITSGATGDFCLFNHPPPKTRSQSPGESSTANSFITLVLHQQPTLYYEPLDQVFTALRQEEVVYTSPELVDNELILEAYDLNLVVGEDNAYASQATIHDLNEIHDRLGLAGPLRLRLTSGSRFITRYHALREQIAQITLNANDRVSGAEQVQEHEDTNEEHPQSAVQDFPGGAEDEGGQAEDTHDKQQDTTTNLEHDQVEGHAEERQEDASGEDEVETQSGAEDEIPGEAGQNQESVEYANPQDADDDDGDRGLELTATSGVHELDADEAHHTFSAEEGGDYVARGEEFQDGDDKFGEALPEELGGSATDESEQPDDEPSYDVDGDADAHQYPGLGMAGSETNDDAPEDSAETVVVPTDEAPLPEENEEDLDGDDATARDTSAGTQEADELYDYADADGEYYTQESYEPEDWDELEDPEAPEGDLLEHAVLDDAASSKQSSETLSTLSKRSRDEDDDEDDGDNTEGATAGSPHLKRVRTD